MVYGRVAQPETPVCIEISLSISRYHVRSFSRSEGPASLAARAAQACGHRGGGANLTSIAPPRSGPPAFRGSRRRDPAERVAGDCCPHAVQCTCCRKPCSVRPSRCRSRSLPSGLTPRRARTRAASAFTRTSRLARRACRSRAFVTATGCNSSYACFTSSAVSVRIARRARRARTAAGSLRSALRPRRRASAHARSPVAPACRRLFVCSPT
jgi:hypothetical protein